MLSYIIRRILLMIPTLIGISFLVFMLVALSPGGVGAALRVSGGGASEQTDKAVLQAYLEDRYGLDKPVVVQYLRWLSRVSPIKFGGRDQVTPEGEQISAPRVIDEPQLWSMFTDTLPQKPEAKAPWPSEATDDQKRIEYGKSIESYAKARAGFVAARTRFAEALSIYGKAAGVKDGGVDGRDIIVPAWRAHTPKKDLPEWEEVETRGQAMIQAYATALDEQVKAQAIFDARIFPQAGVPIVPNVISIGWPDFGRSFSRTRPVMSMVSEALPVTMTLNLIAFPIIYAIAIPMGIATANRSGSAFDFVSGVVFVALWSIPTVWAGVLALSFLASDEYLGWFPVTGLHDSRASVMTFLPWNEGGTWDRGYLLDFLWHVVLPVLCLVYSGFAVLSKQTRASMLDNFNMDYVRTAKAKGVANRTIVFSHVFRNSLLPIITIFATVFPAMLAGSVVIEKIFTIPGMGSMLLQAIYLKDREVILANAVMIAVVNMFALLLADILYAIADPRISYK